MQIKDSFRVSRPLEETWSTLLDVERIAPALPGAQLQEVEGDEYRGIVKVKVGPITAQYKGTATLAEVDEANRRIRLEASGRDSRGQGNAKATIVVDMAADGDGTRVEIDTDLHITGKVAQFARGGVLEEVSSKLLGQFAENLERDILGAGGGAPSAGGTGDGQAAAAGGPARDERAGGGEPGPAAAGTSAAAGPRTIASAPAEPVDLLGVAGAPVAKRLVPLALGALVLFLLWRLLRSRGD
jgi:carbon monoxide dehydrogenase subunit G